MELWSDRLAVIYTSSWRFEASSARVILKPLLGLAECSKRGTQSYSARGLGRMVGKQGGFAQSGLLVPDIEGNKCMAKLGSVPITFSGLVWFFYRAHL